MSAGPVLMKKGEGETLNVMGCGVKFVCGAEQTGKKWSLMENTLVRGMGPPPHQHAWDEAYYVIEGEVRFQLGERVEVLGQGDFLYAPANALHGFQCASDKATMLIFDAPAHTEDFFREVDREVKEMPRDLAKVPEIGARNGIRFAKAA